MQLVVVEAEPGQFRPGRPELWQMLQTIGMQRELDKLAKAVDLWRNCLEVVGMKMQAGEFAEG